MKNLHKDDAIIKKETILMNFDEEELSACHFFPNIQIFKILSLHCLKSRIRRGQFSTLVSLCRLYSRKFINSVRLSVKQQ